MSFAKKWDAVYISKLIAGGEIDKVIDYYKGRYYGDNRDPQDAFKIAELYVKKKDYATAMEWYDKESQLINSSKVNLFNYANTNRLMGEYQKALDGYLMYAALTGDVNKVMDLANQCEKILKSSALAYNFKLENYTFNTAADETNIAILRTNPVYLTAEDTDKGEKQVNRIYQVVREFEYFREPVRAYSNNIPKLQITALSFSRDGNSVVFSAKEERSTSKKDKNRTEKIYMADYLGGNFLNVKPFPFNIEGYSLKTPAFNTDGTAICFSSNQPGGLGGYDLWESYLIKDKWTAPVNAGKLLNTVANEVNPFWQQDGKDKTLYFSSDREGGFGGFDIYAAQKADKVWQDVTLQSAPVNSAGDDISIVYDDAIKTGYFSSNRSGGKGGFDLYRFTPFNLRLLVNTTDTFSEKPVGYAYVQVFDGTEKLFEGVTDEVGKASFQINKDRTYTLKVSKDNMRPLTQKISSYGKSSGDSVVADVMLKPDAQFSIAKGATNSLSLDNYIVFTGKVTDAATNKPSYTAKMRMVNYTTQKLREVDIDASGRFEIKLLLNNNYKIIFENQDNKVTDELTTFGLEKNSVKVRDYMLSGNKFKLTENKVYKAGNVPKSVTSQMENKQISVASEIHEPITQTKIDSLLKVITADDPSLPASVKPVRAPIDVNDKTKETAVLVPSTPSVPVVQKQEILKEVISKPSADSVLTEPVVVSNPHEFQLAADMTPSSKSKKVKIIKTESENRLKEEKIETENVVMKPAEKPLLPVIPEVYKEKQMPEPEPTVINEPSATNGNTVTQPAVEKVQEAVDKATQQELVTAVKKPAEQPLPDVYYKIQLASYDEGNIKFPEFEAYGKVEEVKAYERYIYRLGDFDKLERAKEILETVRAQGYFVAFILQYNKDKVTGIVK